MPITKNIRRKRSIFCQKKKNTSIIDAAVFSKDVWILCKGRAYCNGKFRHWINGIEGIVNRNNWISLNHSNWNEERKLLEICYLNCRFLELNHPLLPLKYQNDFDDYYVERLTRDLVQRYRIRNLVQAAENYGTLPPEPPHQIVEAELPTQV